MNLFAIVANGNQDTIYRIPLSQEVQGEVTNMFIQLMIPYFHEKEEIQFDGNYKADQEELFLIPAFPLNPEIINSGQNGLNYDVLNIEEVEGRIKAIYAISHDQDGIKAYFQHFDTRKIIANRGIPLFLNNQTYSRYVNRGIVITNQITAAYQNQNLYFSSYFNARKIFDLTNYYQEATNHDVDEFLDIPFFNVEDNIGFRDDLNSNLRKKIKSIQDRQVLQNITSNDLQQKAVEFGLDLQFEDNNLNIPRDKNYVKRLIKFLDEDYFITPLTQRRCVTNSKREMN